MQDNVTQADRDRAFPAMKRIYGERIASLAKRGELDAHHVVQAFAAHRLASTTAQSEAVQKLVEALEWYADGMCEGWCEGKDPKACRHIGSDNCAGCPAVVALAAHRESQP